MKSILVTGGAGFIGSHFIKILLSRHDDLKLINLDALTYAGNPANLKEVAHHPAYHFVEGNIADPELVKDLFEAHDFDYVVNFAAESHVDRSIDDAGIFVQTNVAGTQILLDAARAAWSVPGDARGVPRYRDGVGFLQISTDEVYGTLGSRGRFKETSPLAPNSPYAASKAAADMMARAYFNTYNLPVMVTRSSNNYGPGQYPEKLIPLMILRALKKKSLPVYGDGQQVRDWIHVRDHCLGIERVLFRGRPGEVYNIGAVNERKNIEVIELILKILGEETSLITTVQDRLGHDRRYALDSQKITDELGWSPQVPFEAGLEETVAWYENHPDWWLAGSGGKD
ncbi:MAG: dTDP-glucose 4,6-dehydratase [delta proteobacterium ML8_F1]|nr:MAG: dTDP-glucose 4,6-dehydratase [delta proteobacterium ML8_F1]